MFLCPLYNSIHNMTNLAQQLCNPIRNLLASFLACQCQAWMCEWAKGISATGENAEKANFTELRGLSCIASVQLVSFKLQPIHPPNLILEPNINCSWCSWGKILYEMYCTPWEALFRRYTSHSSNSLKGGKVSETPNSPNSLSHFPSSHFTPGYFPPP